jgi:hypothetical protein
MTTTRGTTGVTAGAATDITGRVTGRGTTTLITMLPIFGKGARTIFNTVIRGLTQRIEAIGSRHEGIDVGVKVMRVTRLVG